MSKTWHLSTHNDEAAFSLQEKNIINDIRVEKNNDSSYFSEMNLNPRVYGSGKIYREKAQGDVYGYTKKSLIEMNGSLVPVKELVIPRKGVRYAVYNPEITSSQHYPVGWDGRRWVFESPTSMHVSSELKKVIMGGRNGEHVNADALSAADYQGLQWNGDNSYIKINSQYIKIKKLNANRFYINNDDGMGKVFLRFDNGKLRIEDVSERMRNILSVGLSGRGSRIRTAEEILSSVDGFNEISARELLSKYAFQENGLYSKMSFALDVEQYCMIPLWAERFKITQANLDAGPSGINPKLLSPSGSSSESLLSSVSSTPDDFTLRENTYLRASDLPPDTLLNERGMIERKNFLKLYRVEKKNRVDRRGGPEKIVNRGFFFNSGLFAGPKRMMDGDIVITSRTIEGATHFGNTEFEGNYYLYEIEAMGRRAVSLNENIESNAAFTELRENYAAGSIAELKKANKINTFAEYAYEFDEVHLDNTGEPMNIKLIRAEIQEQ